MEDHFEIISKESWTYLLLQIIEVFVSRTIKAKQFRTLPGILKDEEELDFPITWKGNFHSMADNILLKWTSYHIWKVNVICKSIFILY
jgi:hypothetical protein